MGVFYRRFFLIFPDMQKIFRIQKVMVIVHLLGIYLRGSLIQLIFFPRCRFHSLGFHGFLDNVNDFVLYLVYFVAVYYPALWNHILCLFVVNPRYCKIFSSRLVIDEDVLINVE